MKKIVSFLTLSSAAVLLMAGAVGCATNASLDDAAEPAVASADGTTAPAPIPDEVASQDAPAVSEPPPADQAPIAPPAPVASKSSLGASSSGRGH